MITYKFILSVLFSLVFIFASCKKFEYSPYQSKPVDGDMPHDLNATNVQKIMSVEESSDDTVTILYTGDSQRFYDRLEDLVAKANSMSNIDFFVISGDIADFGILQEYLWVCERLEKLNMPYFCAVGNHDMAANNGDDFTSIFGPKNFSFTYKSYKFLFHDTNSREYGFNASVPDMNWLSNELKEVSASWYVGVAHVPPYDMDFDKTIEKPYKDLFASTPGFILALYGHLHDKNDSFYYEDKVRYMTSNSVEKNEVVLLKLINGKVIKQLISY